MSSVMVVCMTLLILRHQISQKVLVNFFFDDSQRTDLIGLHVVGANESIEISVGVVAFYM
jgi:hypothetical protein